MEQDRLNPLRTANNGMARAPRANLVNCSVSRRLIGLRSPRILGPVVVKEHTCVIWAQLFDEPPYGGHALLSGQSRIRAPHVRLHPSRINNDASDPLWRKIDGSASRHHIHRRLGGPIRNRAT